MSDSTGRTAGKLSKKPYPMRVFWDEEDESWVAEVSDLPGCVGAGDTAQEALETAQGFIKAWIEDALDGGETVPTPSARPQASGRFLARVPRSIHGRLQQMAEEEGVSLNQLVVAILSEGVAARQISAAVERIAGTLDRTVTAMIKTQTKMVERPVESPFEPKEETGKVGAPLIQSVYRRQVELTPEKDQWELRNVH